jgi:hypothetical protein
LLRKEKKDALLKDTYDSGMDPKDFDEMHQKIPPVAKLDSSLHVYGNADASYSGHAAIPEHDDGNDSERTPSPSPHQTKNDSVIRQETNNEESQQPIPNQQNPQTSIPSSEHTSPPPEHHNSPIPEHPPTPQPENTISSDDVVEIHPLRTPVNDVDNSPHHVDDIKTTAMDTPLKERFHQLHKELFSETTSSP